MTKKRTKITEAPTGSGKTAVGTALAAETRGDAPVDWGIDAPGHDAWREKQLETIHFVLDGLEQGRAVSLVRTKSLQRANYEQTYQWDVLTGRSNYPCEHPANFRDATGDDCLYGREMKKCEHHADCPYAVAKGIAQASRKASLNYSYWLVAGRRWPAFRWLVLDEAHLLPDIVLQHVGATITERHRAEWKLPRFPLVTAPKPLEKQDGLAAAIDWLAKSSLLLAAEHKALEKAVKKSKSLLPKMRRAFRLLSKVNSTLWGMEAARDDWYIRAGRRVVWDPYRKKLAPGLVAKPLTARHHFNAIFSATNRLLMSATIGNEAAFCAELGISKDSRAFRQVPSRYPVDQRTVWILDAPRMGRKTDQAGYEKQADVIADAIRSVPPEWPGLIHVTRKTEADLLGDRLRARGLAERIFTVNWRNGYVPTDRLVDLWTRRKEQVTGSLFVTWALGEGYDGSGIVRGEYREELNERINVVAKIGFPFLGDEHERARMKRDGKFFFWRAGCDASQKLGRIWRTARDFGPGNSLVAIADGNWSRVKGYLSQQVIESIKPWSK